MSALAGRSRSASAAPRSSRRRCRGGGGRRGGRVSPGRGLWSPGGVGGGGGEGGGVLGGCGGRRRGSGGWGRVVTGCCRCLGSRWACGPRRWRSAGGRAPVRR